MRLHDQSVESRSSALTGTTIDVVVSGSVGAVESVRLIRALRRLGAQPHVWLTKGASQFVTPQSLEWASQNPIATEFPTNATHIASRDACIVTPASANTIGKVANGIMDTAATALIASYLGERRPVLMAPNMHQSLSESPAVVKNLKQLEDWGVKRLPVRDEEGKWKFPDPHTLADEIAHALNKSKPSRQRIALCMGGTRGYIDDVRFVTNYSSGGLGSHITEELYRRGHQVAVTCGLAQQLPRTFSSFKQIHTNDEMESSLNDDLNAGATVGIFAASVLDFVPNTRTSGKIRSNEPSLTVSMQPTPKIIERVPFPVKVGFKLEPDLDETQASSIAGDYFQRYDLSAMILNSLKEVGPNQHRAYLVEKGSDSKPRILESKAGIARALADHIDQRTTGK